MLRLPYSEQGPQEGGASFITFPGLAASIEAAGPSFGNRVAEPASGPSSARAAKGGGTAAIATGVLPSQPHANENELRNERSSLDWLRQGYTSGGGMPSDAAEEEEGGHGADEMQYVRNRHK